MRDGIRVTRADIHLGSMLHNLNEAKRRVGKAKIMAVVKGNAYGHGMVEVSRFLEKQGIDYLGVALLEEGIELREAGIKTPILVLSCIQEEEAEEALRYNLALNLCSINLAKKLSSAAKKLNKKAVVHIKVDTGHIRYGLLPEDVPAFVKEAGKLKGLCMEGVFFLPAERRNAESFLEPSGQPAKARICFSAASYGQQQRCL